MNYDEWNTMIFKELPTSSDISIYIISKLPPTSDEDKQN